MKAELKNSEAPFRLSERFELVRRLGAGGMGVVFEAYDRQLRIRVALKTLQNLTPEDCFQFKQEFRALADVHHENLVTLGELFEEAGRLYFTMELVEGIGFATYVRSTSEHMPTVRTRTPPKGSLDILGSTHADASSETLTSPEPLAVAGFNEQHLRRALGQLALGLCAVHHAGKVHRDIKPSNILVTDTERLVLLDFGLVSEPHAPFQAPDTALGTPGFMAPEQIQGRAVGAAADWYSVGALLYHALTGDLPFVGAMADVLRLKCETLPVPPSARVDGVPRDLDDLCMGLLQTEPEQRPQGSDVLRRLALRETMTLNQRGRPRVFVGRAQELTFLHTNYQEVRRGQARSVLVHGESGVGKSTLLRRFMEMIQIEYHDTLVMRGRCFEREAVPYKAVDELLSHLGLYLERLPRDEQARLAPKHAHLLARMFPAWQRIAAFVEAPRSDDATPPDQVRPRAFHALRTLLQNISEAHPVIACIEDLQWADDESLHLLRAVSRGPQAPRLLLLASVRAMTEVAEGPLQLDSLTAALGSSVQHLWVPSLPPEDAHELARQLLDEPHDALALATVVEEAGGHPLFINELARHRRISTAAAPLRLQDALRWRIARLEPGTRDLLELVSVAGGPIEHRTAMRAVTPDPQLFRRQVNILRSAHLMRSTGTREHDVIEPFHDRVRQSVLAGLEPAAQRAWHGKLAEALEELGDADPETLGRHWEGAGQHERAAQCFEEAAGLAVDALAFERAARLYRACLDRLPPDTPHAAALRLRLAQALDDAGQGVAAAEVYMEASTAAEPPQSLDLRRRAAELLLHSGHVERGLALMRPVLDALDLPFPEAPWQIRKELMGQQTRALLSRLRTRALGATDLDTLRVKACWSLAQGLALVDPVRGRVFAGRHLALALEKGDSARTARATALEACYASHPGFQAQGRVRRLYRRARALAEASGDPQTMAWVTATEGASAYVFGHWRKAWEQLEQSRLELRRARAGTPEDADTLQLFSLGALAQLGRFETLQRELPARIEAADERNNLCTSLALRSGHLNRAWLARDDPDRARAEAKRVTRILGDSAFSVLHYHDFLAQTHIDLYVADSDAAWLRVHHARTLFSASLLAWVQQLRVFLNLLRGQAALARCASPQHRAEALDEVRGAARSLAGEASPFAPALGQLLKAGRYWFQKQEQRCERALQNARAGLHRADMAVCAASVQRAWGHLVMGDTGREAVKEAESTLRQAGVAAPSRFAFSMVPFLQE